MPSPNANPTPITPPRVPLIDERTGLIDRAWYMFFLSLFDSALSLDDLRKVPDVNSALATYDELLRKLRQELQTAASDQTGELQQQINDLRQQTETADQIGELQQQIDALKQETQLLFNFGVTELQQQINSLQQQVEFTPSSETGELQSQINALTNPSPPAVKTSNFTVANNETWLINNKSGSSCTVTLPTPSAKSGRVLYFLNYQNQTLVSASSNVVPLAGGAATTAILEAVSGANATLVSDGSNWLTMQYGSNNALQLE
jgi:TolA-binding protein